MARMVRGAPDLPRDLSRGRSDLGDKEIPMKRWSTLILLVALAAGLRAEEPPGVEAFSWLEGHWRMTTDDGAVWEEIWTAPESGTVAALTRWMQDGKTRLIEVSAIDAGEDGVPRLTLRHFGPGLDTGPETPGEAERWPLKSRGEREAVFEEPSRPFPRRIVYRRVDDDTLEARLEGEGGEMRFLFRRK